MKKLSKTQKVTLGVFFGILGLMCFHPLGRMIVKIILPLGFGIIDLIGTGFFILFLVFVFFPQISSIWQIHRTKKREPKIKTSTTSDKVSNFIISNFIYELAKVDKESKYVPYFMKVIDIGKKQNKQFLVERFLDYYGKLTIKFLGSQVELSNHGSSVEIKRTSQNIVYALEDIKQICDNFIAKMIDDDILDLNADITVLGQISISENLK